MVNLNRTVADVIDTNIPHWAALTAVTTDAENGAYAPGVTTGTLTVTLHEDEDVRSWLNQEGATDPNDKLEGAYAEYACSTVLGASMDGGKTIIPLYIAPDGSQMVVGADAQKVYRDGECYPVKGDNGGLFETVVAGLFFGVEPPQEQAAE